MEGKKIDDGGAAFARPHSSIEFNVGDPQDHPAQAGMSLRDWFAGMALQGLCANHMTDATKAEHLADLCFHYADAMIEARGK